MSKKKLYGMLLFMLFTFTLLGIVINKEFNQYSNWKNQQKESENTENSVINEGNASTEENQPGGTNVETTQESSQEETSTPPLQEQGEDDSADNLKDSGDTVLVFSGDIFMSDYILNKYSKEGIDGILSKELQEEYANADIAMVNQEFPFSNRGKPMEDKQFTFRIDPKWVKIFSDMQIDIVTLANNHTLDYGLEALQDTFNTLDTANIQYVGAGNNIEEAKDTKYFEVDDKTIAVLGASRVIPVPGWNAGSNKPGLLTTYDPATLIKEIQTAKELSDYIVVYVHWGIEKDTSPKEYQRNLAKQYIDAGADLVVGSHPHVLQGIEYYKDKPIIYSLGNFMFYNAVNQTAVLKVTIKEDEVEVQLLPCKAENACTYKIEDQVSRSEFYQYMEDISFEVNFDDNGTVLNKRTTE